MLIALDIAILPPQAISQRAIELSAALPEKESKGLRLGGDVLPHVTLTQHFIQTEDFDAVFDRAGAVLAAFTLQLACVVGTGTGRAAGYSRFREGTAQLGAPTQASPGFKHLPLKVTGPARGESSVWMAIERTPALIELHRRLMDELRPFERPDGTAAAFVNADARPGDVAWVAGFRRTSSYEKFTPHITLGHAAGLPAVERLAFDATTVAACHLGKFCTCRRVLRTWVL